MRDLDKAVHLCEYLLLAWGLAQATRGPRYSSMQRVVIGLVAPISYGIALEGIQSLLPYRSAEVMDAVANAVGAALGMMGSRWWSRSIEARG